MSAPTKSLTAQLAADLTATLTRLRRARLIGDWPEARVCEKRLNWLIERLPRKENP
jgi:hypothetical protein